MIQVRLATPSDFDSLQALYALCISGADWLPPKARQSPVFAEVSRGEQIHVATDSGGALVGLVSVWPPESFVHHLYVLPNMRGQGVGHLLLAALWSANLPLPWRLKCVRLNQRALEFYFYRGWQEVGGGDSEHGPYALLEFDQSLQSCPF